MFKARPRVGMAMVVTGCALFALNGTVSKLVLRAGLSPAQLTTLRATGAAVGLLPVLALIAATRRARPLPRHRPRAGRADLALVAGYGVIGFFLVPLLYFVAISRLPVGIALLFEYTAPLLVALWARFGQGQRVRPRLWAGLALSLTGLAGVAEVWGRFALDGVGVLAGLAAAAGLAVYYLLGARGVRRGDTTSLTAWGFGFAALTGLLGRLVAGPGDWSALTGSSGGVPVWLLCCYVVVLGSIAPYLLIAGSLRHLPATSVGIIGMIEPVLAAAIAWLALGEVLNRAQLSGGLLVLLGVILAETARVGGPPRPAPAVGGVGKVADAGPGPDPAADAGPDPVAGGTSSTSSSSRAGSARPGGGSGARRRVGPLGAGSSPGPEQADIVPG